MKSLCFLLALALIVLARGGKECRVNEDCGESECCQILVDNPAVERREIKSGTCEPYNLFGEECQAVDRINGRCGCQPGLECLAFKDEEEPIFGRRKRGNGIVPGWTWKCAANDV